MDKSIVIAVFCYKRAGKLKACIEALLKNPECPNFDIIFFSDGYKSEQDKNGVLETRSYIESITGFKNVIKHFRERNLSTGPNFHEGIEYLRNNYEEFIVVEDDLIVSSNYIKYMLDALDFYRNEKSVFCVTGYVYPINIGLYPFDTIIYKRFCSYGWAGWADRFKNVIWSNKELDVLMKTLPGFEKQLNAEGYDLSRMLRKQIDGRISTWDVQLQVHVSQNNLKVVYPALSKVNNIGFDEESTNTYGINYLITPFDDGSKRDFKFCDSGYVIPALQEQIKKPFSLKQLVKRKIINTVIKATKQVKKAN